ncbi:MAG TPA: hypothetical protein PKG89_02345, partial [Ferruginibacter sp.]|nr:hypothetical protein [Ferruginibacter sp.]
KNIFKISSQKFGSIGKLFSSLHRKTNFKTTNMLRIQLHTEAMNRFSPKGYDAGCGACYAVR